jgi:hypothetical protein
MIVISDGQKIGSTVAKYFKDFFPPVLAKKWGCGKKIAIFLSNGEIFIVFCKEKLFLQSAIRKYAIYWAHSAILNLKNISGVPVI